MVLPAGERVGRDADAVDQEAIKAWPENAGRLGAVPGGAGGSCDRLADVLGKGRSAPAASRQVVVLAAVLALLLALLALTTALAGGSRFGDARTGGIVDLSDTWQAAERRGWVEPSLREAFAYRDRVYGLPMNLEALLRRAERSFGDDVDLFEKLRAPLVLHHIVDGNEDYWERGEGSAPPPTDVRYHNLGIYGWDVREWEGCAVLRGARETASCAWVSQHAPGNPAALAEFRRRVASLRDADPTVRWHPF